jgi:hypothetical protein
MTRGVDVIITTAGNSTTPILVHGDSLSVELYICYRGAACHW